ncbi:hypothetical protein NDU88_001455 [Pleurodeles waltl]|uniref:Uncharacterized protein n=1 Tax=Pleurodeles waltl TaxID=8319 RepID=A0AAV7T0E1_PLEWA|nr:hypothetical protein NDU88_001455 [Pleurodeles waltl]
MMRLQRTSTGRVAGGAGPGPKGQIREEEGVKAGGKEAAAARRHATGGTKRHIQWSASEIGLAAAGPRGAATRGQSGGGMTKGRDQAGARTRITYHLGSMQPVWQPHIGDGYHAPNGPQGWTRQ